MVQPLRRLDRRLRRFPRSGPRVLHLPRDQKTLGLQYPGTGREGSITAGLDDLADLILGREWRNETGGVVPVESMLVDANYETETIFAWARSSPHLSRIMPSRGSYYGATSKPINERKRRRGDRTGPGWYVAAPGGRRAIPQVVWDANYFKSHFWARMMTPRGDRGALYLPGRPEESRTHRMLADQLTAETRQRVTASSGRSVEEWQNPRKLDNHLFDTIVGNCVAASVRGVSLLDGERREGSTRRRKVVNVEEARRRMAV